MLTILVLTQVVLIYVHWHWSKRLYGMNLLNTLDRSAFDKETKERIAKFYSEEIDKHFK